MTTASLIADGRHQFLPRSWRSRPIALDLYNIMYNSDEIINMRIISFSDARNNLKQVIDKVVDDADVAVISRRDLPDAVVMSLDTFNSWMETIHLLKTPANAAHLAKSIRQLRTGKARARPLADA